MRKRLAGLVALVALVAGACSDGDKSATTPSTRGDATRAETLPIGVDATTDGFGSAWVHFFPHDVKAHPGDTLEFTSHFTGEPHTVAFGTLINEGIVAYSRLDPSPTAEHPPELQALLDKIPFVFTDDGGPDNLFVQAAAQPCYLVTGEPPTTEACPKDKQRPPKQITGRERFLNSGYLPDGKAVAFKLSAGIAPGAYTFMCLVHGPKMSEKVMVVDKATAIPGSDDVAAEGRKHLDEFVSQVKPLAQKVLSSTSAHAPAGAGVEDKAIPSAGLNVFPAEIDVKAGEKVTWTVNGFHTISFNAPEDARPWLQFDGGGALRTNQKSFTPAASPVIPPPPPRAAGAPDTGVPPPLQVDAGTWDGQGFHSSGAPFSEGLLLYSLAFATPGTYTYTCLVHPDMDGSVKVT